MTDKELKERIYHYLVLFRGKTFTIQDCLEKLYQLYKENEKEVNRC